MPVMLLSKFFYPNTKTTELGPQQYPEK